MTLLAKASTRNPSGDIEEDEDEEVQACAVVGARPLANPQKPLGHCWMSIQSSFGHTACPGRLTQEAASHRNHRVGPDTFLTGMRRISEICSNEQVRAQELPPRCLADNSE